MLAPYHVQTQYHQEERTQAKGKNTRAIQRTAIRLQRCGNPDKTDETDKLPSPHRKWRAQGGRHLVMRRWWPSTEGRQCLATVHTRVYTRTTKTAICTTESKKTKTKTRAQTRYHTSSPGILYKCLFICRPFLWRKEMPISKMSLLGKSAQFIFPPHHVSWLAPHGPR